VGGSEPCAKKMVTRALEQGSSWPGIDKTLRIIDDFRKGLQLSWNNPDNHLWYALFLRSESRFQEAIEQANAGTEIDPPIVNMTVGSTYLLGA
jgi:hypothetical protein